MTITVGKSLYAKAVAIIVPKKIDENLTKAPVVVKSVDENVSIKSKTTIVEVADESDNLDDEKKYQKWKKVVMSQDIGNIDFLNMLKEKYPKEFERLRKEMTK